VSGPSGPAPAGARFALSTRDGWTLVAHRFDAGEGTGVARDAKPEADRDTARGVVVVGPAMGVPQTFYFDFARWLAAHGWTALTFDHRGIGHSLDRPLRGHPATLTDWMREDWEAVLAHAHALAGGRTLAIVGHSLGAQLPAVAESARHVDAMVTVAGGSGHVRGFGPRMRPFFALLTHVIAPASIRVAGYFPGRRLGIIGDLPAGVMHQWRRWCRHPDYLLAHEPGAREAYARAAFPILSLSFTDDAMMPQVNVDTLQAHFRSAPREVRRISPREAGARAIGHVGFFRRRFADTLWPPVLAWLDARAARPAAAPATRTSRRETA
jgi:predicted alpha/beta hydrolase